LQKSMNTVAFTVPSWIMNRSAPCAARLHDAESEAGEQKNSVRQHVVRLARPDPGVRSTHHADTGPPLPDDVGPTLLKSERIGGRQRCPRGSQASVAPTKTTAAASLSTVS
jgi:hypothetical protein